MLKNLILKNRSCRRFVQSEFVHQKVLKYMVDLGRLSASAANLQPLRYIISNHSDKNNKIFSCLAWAGYLKDWPGPAEGERPPAYILILSDNRVSKKVDCDHGIAAQSITLGAAEMGYAACMITSIKRDMLRKNLNIPQKYDILMAIALGKCDEQIKLEELKPEQNIEYWRDEAGIHHIPKRPLEDVILKI